MSDCAEIFDVGDEVRLAAVFKNIAGTLIDPAVVNVTITNPAGTATTYTYPVTVIKDSTGNYHIDVDANAPGTWTWRWYSTGSGKAAQKGSFRVE
jgi:uncharacterized protein YfaS (alpha-2-macroglobulin family)